MCFRTFLILSCSTIFSRSAIAYHKRSRKFRWRNAAFRRSNRQGWSKSFRDLLSTRPKDRCYCPFGVRSRWRQQSNAHHQRLGGFVRLNRSWVYKTDGMEPEQIAAAKRWVDAWKEVAILT